MKTLKQALDQAVIDYLVYNTTPPEQLNLAFIESHGWRIEFHENESAYNNGFFTWMSGQEVLEIFFSRDESLIDLSAWPFLQEI